MSVTAQNITPLDKYTSFSKMDAKGIINIKPYVHSMLRMLGYDIHRIVTQAENSYHEAEVAYRERAEYGPVNLQVKLDRVKSGGPFELPEIENLNTAVELLIGQEKRIVEFGSGTGKFASYVAKDDSRFVVASEFDKQAHCWCLSNIPKRSNLIFINGPIPADMRPFDLSVSIEVVEHVADYMFFLKEMSEIAPRSLITTPNRARSASDYYPGPPHYFQHVREWTAGEFYWVLRCFWKDVVLYGLISQSEPSFIKIDVDSPLSPLIADCRNPIHYLS
jgi:hypothetical protein